MSCGWSCCFRIIVSATCGVFSTHCSSSKAPVATASSEREMSSHLVGKLRGLSSWEPQSRIRPNSHMVRPAVRLPWQRHKNRYGPRDRLVLTKWFPALSILSRNSCAIFCFSSRCCFASHSERGLRLPFKIHTVSPTIVVGRNCSFTCTETLLFWFDVFWGLCCRHCPHPRPTKKTVTMWVVTLFFFQWFVIWSHK